MNNFMDELNEIYTKSVDDLVIKYPMTNSEWVFINGRWNLYEIIDICVDTYGRNKHGIYRMTLLEKQAYNTRMAVCMRYKNIDRFFVRRLDISDRHNFDKYKLDPWNRQFVVYDDTFTQVWAQNTELQNKLYFNGYLMEDIKNGQAICSLNVTSIEGKPIYCLDAYKFDKY